METPKYHIGQIVHFAAPEGQCDTPGRSHRVERLLPPEKGEHQYQVKAVDTGHEQIAREGQIGGQAAVEALAQSLYEASNTTNVAWVRRDRTIRDPWVKRALAQLSSETEND